MLINKETLLEDNVSIFKVYMENDLIVHIEEKKLLFNKNDNCYVEVTYPLVSSEQLLRYDNIHNYSFLYKTYEEASTEKKFQDDLINSYQDKLKAKDEKFVNDCIDLLISVSTSDIDPYYLKEEECIMILIYLNYTKHLILR